MKVVQRWCVLEMLCGENRTEVVCAMVWSRWYGYDGGTQQMKKGKWICLTHTHAHTHTRT